MEFSKVAWKYLHPLSLIEEVSTTIWPFAEPHLDKLSDDEFTLVEKLFNMASVLAIHKSFRSLSWGWFFQLVMMLGIVKRTLSKRGEKMNVFIEQNTEDYSKASLKPGRSETTYNSSGVRFAADRVQEFCVENRKPSLEWLNRIILTLWLNFRALAKFKFLNEFWPKVKKKLQGTQLNNLEIHDFNIGDKPFRIINIECIKHSDTDLVIDAEIAYDGSANITITYSQESLNISIPVTLQKFSVSNIKVRIVLKGLTTSIPFVGGIQLFFLESPIIDWQTADAAKVIDLPGLDSLLKSAIENQIVKRFVLPNRLSLPIKVPEHIVQQLRAMNLRVVQGDEYRTALPVPVGVCRVTATKAEGLRATDLGFQHYSTSKNINPCNLKTFSCSELLPKKGSGDPYVQISIGRAKHRSRSLKKDLGPEWNFTCDFPVEYFQKAQVKIEIFDDDVNIAGISGNDPLGRITEKLKRIEAKKTIEGWYNCEIYQGRAYLRFEWITLKAAVPSNFETATSVSGVLCLLIGTLKGQDIIRPTCFLEMLEGNELAKATSLDAVSNDTSWTFNEGKIFRVKNFKEKNCLLTMKIRDNKTWRWIGERKFYMRRLLETALHGEYKFPNPFSQIKPVSLSISTRILYDSI